MSDTPIEAAVQVGAEVTRYLRCGRGGRVTLVIADTSEERARLLRRHAASGCAIAPVLDDLAEADVVQWLERTLPGMIEGLGLDRPRLVLSNGLAGLAGLLADSEEAVEVLKP